MHFGAAPNRLNLPLAVHHCLDTLGVELVPVVRHGTDQLRGSGLDHRGVVADHFHALAFGRRGHSLRVGVVRDDVAALADKRIGRIGFLARVIPGVGPDHVNLHVGIDGLRAKRVGVDALEHFGNRHSGNVTQVAILAHRSGKLACEITSLIKTSVVVAEIVGRLITRAVFELHIGKFLGHLESRVHEFEARRKDDLIALRSEIANHAFGVGHRRDVFHKLRLDLVAELLLDQLTRFIVLLGPTFVGARARIDPGCLQRAGRSGGGRSLCLLRSRFGRIVAAAGQHQAGSGSKSQGNFLECHQGCLFEKKGKYGNGESWRDFISYRLDAEKDKTGAPAKRLSLAFAPVFRQR